MKNKLTNLLLILVLLFSLFIRSINLESNPKGLQSDEASFLFNSVALMETGMDEDGKRFPLYLESLIDSKPAVYSYLQIPFIKIFGATTAASRMPSALIGTLGVYLFYVLINKVFKNKRLALFGALFFAISPWHIMNSRATQEVIVSLTLITANLIFAYDILYKKYNKKTLVLFFLTALTGMYFYHAAKIVLLLFYFAVAVLTSVKKLPTKKEVKPLLLLVCLTLLSFIITAQAALTRFSAIGLLNDELPKALIWEYSTISTDHTPLLAIRSFYNKPVMFGKYFLENYLAHFDLNYLFINGGATRRFIVPNHGLFYLFDLLLIPLGIYALIKKKTKYFITWLLLLIISPIPAALTTEEIPSSIRAFTLIIPLTISSILGLDWILNNLNKYFKAVFIAVFSVFIVWSVSYFAQHMFVIMPLKNTLFRSRSYEVVSQKIAQIQEDYDSIYFTSDLREMYIYLWQKDLITIQQVQEQPLARYTQSYNLGKYYFNHNSCEFPELDSNTLYVAPHNCAEDLKAIYTQVDTANFDDDTPGFILLNKRK